MKPTNTIRIVAAVLDTHNLRLYKECGETVDIPQGDPRIALILKEATADITHKGYADITMEAENASSFKQVEEKSGGVLRFFRVAKSKLLDLFSNEPAAHLHPTSVGTIPTKEAASLAALEAATAEIIKHAVPASSDKFSEVGLDKQANIVESNGATPKEHTASIAKDTIIAVVDNKIVQGMEKIKTHFDRAAKLGSTTGVENFVRRMGAMTSKRSHSVDDLLKFMERADLPIAEDGSILIYKVLRKDKGHFVDCHTRKVPQKVGSYVCMDESLVDHNRNNECSNGLHVARRGYISSFTGDVCVMAKLAPEDVIAVPSYDANKMRVCGYHIIHELSKEMYAKLCRNQAITDTAEGRQLLAEALSGDHIGIIEEVRIKGHMGNNVEITSRKDQPPVVAAKPVVTAPVPIPEAHATALENPDVAQKAAPVDPKQVVTEVINLSRKDMAQGLYATFIRAVDPAEKVTALQALRDYKKSCKVGWDKLGLPDLSVTQVITQAKSTPKAKVTPQPKTKGKAMSMTPREQIQHLLPQYKAAVGKQKTEFAKDILKVKQLAKKSWDVLGVPEDLVSSITLRTE